MVADKVTGEFSNHQELTDLLSLAQEQSNALVKTMEKINEFEPSIKIIRSEQLYYVKSPIMRNGVLSIHKETSAQYWAYKSGLSNKFQTKFNQSELDEIQKDIPGLNIEFLKVRVEEYDNGQDK